MKITGIRYVGKFFNDSNLIGALYVYLREMLMK
ncbi:hypothetical protein C823_001293 [Eubacterium plexicaudatum ASF492]|uniref:Uncharacterized protein n=1 Tax=Eubacterium plexicaudatum ASF492 TaxID=1235802 RepID=N2BBV5_9FIRM|nr:hypothetical protein C823_001293 [Eubacterium plexicaudatum ASF492]